MKSHLKTLLTSILELESLSVYHCWSATVVVLAYSTLLEYFPNSTSALGYDWIEPISYGYDQDGELASVLANAPLKDRIVLLTISGLDLFEDFFQHYSAPRLDAYYPDGVYKECGEIRDEDARVAAGMKCGSCAYGIGTN